MSELITNEKRNHYNLINFLVKKSNQVIFSVAFLKYSGLSLLIDTIEVAVKKGTKFKIFCGSDFYITEPKALICLYKIFDKNKGNFLYLYDTKKINFHPKLFYFVCGRKVSIIAGSANFTAGGLQGNIEVSMFDTVSKGSAIDKQLTHFFKELEKSKDIIPANNISISQYKRRYELYNKKIKDAEKEAKKEINKIVSSDTSKILKYLEKYKKNEKNKKNEYKFKNRLPDYRKAKKVLNTLLTAKINSKRDFMYYYEQLVGKKGMKRCWHSGGLFRSKNEVAKKYRVFIKMLREIKNNLGSKPEEIFTIGKRYADKINGLGVNVLTEVMSTYSPQRYALLNKNPLTSLEFFGFSKFPAQYYFKPETYGEYNALINEFKKLCSFKSMMQVDHFLNFIYWHYAKKNRTSETKR